MRDTDRFRFPRTYRTPSRLRLSSAITIAICLASASAFGFPRLVPPMTGPYADAQGHLPWQGIVDGPACPIVILRKKWICKDVPLDGEVRSEIEMAGHKVGWEMTGFGRGK